jgi:hypothetical protein
MRTAIRKRRTKAVIEQLDCQIVGALEADHPQSVRHVFYLMTDPRLPEPVEKSDRGYNHVKARLKLLRRSSRVPYAWITDMSRQGYFVNTYRDAADFIRRMRSLYRADLWEDADYYVEVWGESRSIASVLLSDCKEFGVSLYPAGGFSSISFAREAAEEINKYHEGREVVVLYVGDYDPAGVLIDVALEKELRLHLNSSVSMNFRRIAVTEAQVIEYRLPGKPRKPGEKRAPHILETVEAEAMPAHVTRELLRSAIEELLPPRALETARVAEESEKRILERLAWYAPHMDVDDDDD